MASTSNKNSPGNYEKEQQMNKNIDGYRGFLNSAAGEAYTNHLPGDGLLPASNARKYMCGNYCDVESQLRGIGSTNLVNPQTPVTPKLYNTTSLSVFDKTKVIIPEPVVVQTDQRPYPLR